MFKNKKLFIGIVSSLAIIAIGVTALVSYTTASASAQTARSGFALNGDLAQRGGPGERPAKGGADDTYLAQALGITVEELQAAQTAAWQKAIDQALAKGLITQTQADQLKTNTNGGVGRGGLGMFLVDDNAIDMNALLAEELGISADELQAARQKASELEIQARIDSGELTEEQAELMKIHQALQSYIDREKLSAAALGMSVEELQTARQEGQRTADLLEAQGMTQEEYQTAYQAAFEAVIQQAVKDGVITQAQADLVLANMDSFNRGADRGGMPGIGGDKPQGGRGGHGSAAPAGGCNCDCSTQEGQPTN